MFKIEYDIPVGNRVRSFTFDFIFHSLWAAELKARDIRNDLHADAYIYNTETGEIVSYFWAD